jgi:hypothetical protein
MMSEGVQHHSVIFDLQFLLHIFHGERRCAPSGRIAVSGFHYEGTGMRAACGTKVIEGTRTEPDGNGVYLVRVVVEGRKKKEKSLFFPRHWTRVRVLQAVKEAWTTKQPMRNKDNGRWWQGRTTSNMRVVICIDGGRVATAFPLSARGASPSTKCSRQRCRLRRKFRKNLILFIVLHWMRQNNSLAMEVRGDGNNSIGITCCAGA